MKPLLVVLLMILANACYVQAQAQTEDFTYTVGDNLASKTGGTGWDTVGTPGWADGGSGAITAQTAPSGCFSGTAVRSPATETGTVLYYRITTATLTANTFSWYQELTIANPNDFVGVIFGVHGTADYIYVEFASDSNIKAYDNVAGGYVTIAPYSANVCYLVEVQIDTVGQANKFRARVSTAGGSAGTYSSWLTVVGGTFSGINQWQLNDSATNDHFMWWDAIGAPSLPSASNGQYRALLHVGK